MPLIAIDSVSHYYGEGDTRRRVLSEVTTRLTEHRIGVIGANGSGKSTFARLLNGLVIPTSGQVSIDGEDTRRHARRIRRRVGFCFTDPDLQILMPTVREDVAFGLRSRGLTREQVATRVDAILETYGLAGHADHPAHLLSGGQKQLLALAAVLAIEPDVLVLDEPTTLLDHRNTARVSDLIAGLPQQVVLVTHDLELVSEFDRVLVFEASRLVHDGAPVAAIGAYRELIG
jgi:biotin transport system ATP-binding protein